MSENETLWLVLIMAVLSGRLYCLEGFRSEGVGSAEKYPDIQLVG